jgi:hypothetical protein
MYITYVILDQYGPKVNYAEIHWVVLEMKHAVEHKTRYCAFILCTMCKQCTQTVIQAAATPVNLNGNITK